MEYITLVDGRRVTLDEALERAALQSGGVLARFGDWVVTRTGVECLATEYSIDASALGYDWRRHVADKVWATPQRLADLSAALDFASKRPA